MYFIVCVLCCGRGVVCVCVGCGSGVVMFVLVFWLYLVVDLVKLCVLVY